MNILQRLDRFQLHDDLSRDDQVKPVNADLLALEEDVYVLLLLERHATVA